MKIKQVFVTRTAEAAALGKPLHQTQEQIRDVLKTRCLQRFGVSRIRHGELSNSAATLNRSRVCTEVCLVPQAGLLPVSRTEEKKEKLGMEHVVCSAEVRQRSEKSVLLSIRLQYPSASI
ncbi:unnamed protein product [Sphacelaria rigidula]